MKFTDRDHSPDDRPTRTDGGSDHPATTETVLTQLTTLDEVQLLDTTLRDGEQMPGVSLTPAEKVDVARELDATGIALADLDEHMQLLNEGLSEAGIEYEQDVIHAGAAETAMVLAIDDGLVRTENIASGPEGEISAARLLSEGFKTITQNGVLGDPTKATSEAGEVIVQNVVERYVEHIKTERDAV